jgi:alpha-ketoglutarate-dependent taurine dioxygenase
VVFFRKQTNLTNDLQKKFILRLGELTGRPTSSTLHIHPMLNGTNEFGVPDNEISTISSLARKKFFVPNKPRDNRKYDAAAWHSDIQFEPCPADYTSLRLTQLPANGGDTLWASGYDIYDRFSKPYQEFLEGLTATYIGDGFIKAANEGRASLFKGERGSPANVGGELSAVHPLVRTNPVTGWKTLFSIGSFPKYINELNADESEELLQKFRNSITSNHDLQVRFKWRNENDIGKSRSSSYRFPISIQGVSDFLLAIWDNRSAFHAATFDYEGLGERFGNRVVGIGERPFLDPSSTTKAEALSGTI